MNLKSSPSDERRIFAETKRRLVACLFIISSVTTCAYVLLWILCSHNLLSAVLACVICAGGVFFGTSLSSNYILQPGREGMRLIREFTDELGHELATPLTSMKSQLQLISQRNANNQLETEFRVVEENIERMVSLIDDIRVLTALEANRRHPELSIISLDSLIKDTIASFAADFKIAQINWQCEDVKPVSVIADRDGLIRVFSNLCKNALSYVPAGGTVSVALDRDCDDACVTFHDDGCGIPSAELENIFERFYRVSSAGDSKTKGTGLGLTIVKTIINAHGGSIEASNSPGAGLQFIIRLPRFPSVHPLTFFISGGDK